MSEDERFLLALKAAIKIADEKFDGHVTIMKFTTNWRVEFGSQRFFDGGFDCQERIDNMAEGKTLKDAIDAAIDRL